MDLRERSGGARRHPWEVARSGFFRSVIADHVDRPARHAGARRRGRRRLVRPRAAAPDLAPTAAHRLLGRQLPVRRTSPRRPASASPGRRNGPTGPFDLVLLLDVIEHVEDDEAFVADEVVPLLAEGGTGRGQRAGPSRPVLRPRPDARAPPPLPAERAASPSRAPSDGSWRADRCSRRCCAPRAFDRALERAGRQHDPTGVGAWIAGPGADRRHHRRCSTPMPPSAAAWPVSAWCPAPACRDCRRGRCAAR